MAERIELAGRGRLLPSGQPSPAQLTLDDASFTLAVGRERRVAEYRDLDTIAIEQSTALLVLGNGPGSERFLLDGFAEHQGQLVRELRDRRLRQRLGDALVEVPDDPIVLVEYSHRDARGIAQLVYHGWGVVLAPLDERLPWLSIRRSEIRDVTPASAEGRLDIAWERGMGDGTADRIELPGLGPDGGMHGARFAALRDAAAADAGRLVTSLIPDAEYGARQEAARTLIDGRPARPIDLPAAWPSLEAGVLVEPTFAASYGALRARAGDLAEDRMIAIAPSAPGSQEARTWFFVPLPGNLLAMELVSEGAHATYCFRVQPRAGFAGGPTSRSALGAAVRDVSEALVDSRFLREPMALPDDQLRQPRYLRYLLALRALPSLAAARARFVARIVHRDDASWAAALDDLIAWHGGARDDAAIWPGRAAQEAAVDDGAANDLGQPTANDLGQPAANDLGQPAANDLGQPAANDLGQPAANDLGQPAANDLGQPAANDLGEPAPTQSSAGGT